MDWLNKTKKDGAEYQKKIQQIIDDRRSYNKKVKELRGICKGSDNKKLAELFSKINLFMKEWLKGPTRPICFPNEIILTAEKCKTNLDKLFVEINKELFPC